MFKKPLYQEGKSPNFLNEGRLRPQIKPSFLAYISLLLPILIAAFPVLFHYGNNSNIVSLPSLFRTLLLYCGISISAYLVFLIYTKGKSIRAANAAFIFMVFFNIYGTISTYLLRADKFQVENYTLFPLFLLVAIYAAWIMTKFEPVGFWKTAIFITGIMVAFNLFKIVLSEAEKYKNSQPQTTEDSPVNVLPTGNNYPDIYYFMFDEFASFETMKAYWNYQGVDDFANFLSTRGFHVIENSQVNSIDTLHLMSERLNYKNIDIKSASLNTYYDAISNNRVMAYLKSQGYTTVSFSEINFGYPAMPPIEADYSYTYGSSDVTQNGVNSILLFDDFGMLVAQNTMLQILNLPNRKSIDPIFTNHQDMVYFTEERVTNLSDIPSPKFVYVHLLLPHYPFMFKENGTPNQPEGFYNWNNYLGNYKFTVNYIKRIINDLQKKADPAHPFVIIIQSDHGPRNIVVDSRGGIPLENFPEELKTKFFNAVYLPGCDTSDLTKQINPINTFPIVFNCYFNAEIPLQ